MRDAFLRLDSNRRFALIALVGGLLALAFVLARRASTPDFVVLFRGLDLAEVGNITDHLGKASIQYRLDAGGSDVEVPEADAARARVLLAKDGLPANGRPGLELFDKPTWGMTDFTEHITYRRALEGELARTIGTLRGVTRAQVHLAIPETTPLRNDDHPAEAAVVVSLASGVTLSADQVQGIARLVSGSVEQLTPDHVTVLDDSGRPLAGAEGDTGNAALTAHQLDVQQTIEQHLATKVEQLLASAVGPSDAKVQVAARLNFDQVERSIDTYDPQGKVLSNEQRSSGSTGNPGDSAAAGQTIINNTYLNSRKIEKIIGETGNVTRLTVSVMINSHALKTEGSAQDDQRAAIATLVRNAIGIDSTRGDQLSVVAVPFNDPPVVKAAADKPLVVPLIERAAPWGLPITSVLAIVAALVLGLRVLKTAPAPPAQLGAGSAEGIAPGAGQSEISTRHSPPSIEHAAGPDAAARVIRAWLAEPS